MSLISANMELLVCQIEKTIKDLREQTHHISAEDFERLQKAVGELSEICDAEKDRRNKIVSRETGADWDDTDTYGPS